MKTLNHADLYSNMQLQRLLSFLKFNEPQRVLGRWGVVYCHNAIDQKVTLTNEDHCGSCGSTPISKRLEKQMHKEMNRDKMSTWVTLVRK